MFEPMTKYNLLSDFELLDLVRLGNERAFSEIYDRYFGLLYLHALNRLKDRDEAKDVVQDVFSSLWSAREHLEMKINFSNYLYTSVRNRILNLIAHKSVKEKYINSLSPNSHIEAITDFRVRENQLRELIEEEINKLPLRMKTVFLLSRKSNKTYIEIARDLSITEQSVRSHVKNALRILRVKLSLIIFMILLFY
jgi:RNA polymerase sigma-70 factor (family 1)